MSKILSIDDEPSLLQLFKVALAHKGHEVFVTASVEDGLRILGEQDIALVMLDVHMPERSGVDVYREIRRRKSVPVLFVTGDPRLFRDDARPGARFLQQEVSHGRADVLFKPFDAPTLFDKVDSLLPPAAKPGTRDP